MLTDAICSRKTVHFILQDISTEPTATEVKAQASKKPASSKLEPADKGEPLAAADETWRAPRFHRAKLRQKIAEAKATPAAALCSAAEQRYILKRGSLGVEPTASTEVCKSCYLDCIRLLMIRS
jgi:hypothetical protein